ncbi:protein lava lamp-like isoform X2 [Syngnathoides biaculeatus]|uniref:protein lava lamp-like isoform X2 n=1 Tax=Syngnathoides biaculeatus TaxID=300417 RepID=UPI002ADDB418|nr:protein lava lamp-like isoform X2 [Syngnathoides biaculeatus]
MAGKSTKTSQKGEAITPEERLLLNSHSQSESGETILLQLLEFKTHLLEAVVELHIRRDTEARYENQLGKVVLEKQELEWEKENLQNQMETFKKQHVESVINVKKQLQTKIRNTEEEKGKYKVISELKEREISNLKEELKSLQLLKYNFEKQSNELEQKQTLQIQSKDSHLIQIGEVEKRFGALSRQCVTLKKAHEQLEQNVNEAIKRNEKLTATNEKHEATIQSLIKELQEVNTKLIKAKLSSVQHNNTYSMMTQTEQNLNQMRYKLSKEKEINKRLHEEYAALRSEKQEVIRSLQHTQQLFLNQTQAVNRLELQLQTREDQYKALKQEHEEMQEKTKAMEEKVSQLTSEQQDFQALKGAHDNLRQKHTKLSAQMLPSLLEGTRERPPDEPKSSFMLPVFGTLQNSAVSQYKIPDCLECTSIKNKVDGEIGGQGTPMFQMKSETQLQVQWEETFSIHSPIGLLGLLETMDSGDTLLNKNTRRYNTSEKLSKEVSNLICSTSHQSDSELANSLVHEITISNSGNVSGNDQLTKHRKSDYGSTSQRGADCSRMDKVNEVSNNSDGGRRNECEPRNTEDLLEEMCTEEQKNIIICQTADGGNSEEYNSMGAHESNTEISAEISNGEKEEGKTEMKAQTTCDIKCNDLPDSDFVDISEKIGSVCEADCHQKDTEKVSDRSHVEMTEFHLLQDISCPEEQNFNNGAIAITQEAQHLCQADAESVNSSLTAVEKTEMMRLDESTANSHTKFSSLIQSAESVSQIMIEPTNNTSTMTHTDEMSGKDTYEVKKTIVDAKGGAHNQSTADLTNGGMEDFESDAYKEACEMAFQTQPVRFDRDLKMSISHQDNSMDSKNSESVLSGSIQLKNGNVELLEVFTSKFLEQPAVKETLVNVEELSLPILKTYRSSFDWCGAIKQTVLTTATADCNLQPNAQNSSVSEQNSSSSCGLLTQFPCTFSLKRQQNKEPLMIIRASDLLKASSAPGSTGFGRKHKMREWSIFGESFKETSAIEESRVSLPAPSCPVASFSRTWPTPSSKTSVPGVLPRSDAELEPLCSQEEQLSSFRAQISKIEQFLQTERLHLSKRRRTDN